MRRRRSPCAKRPRSGLELVERGGDCSATLGWSISASEASDVADEEVSMFTISFCGGRIAAPNVGVAGEGEGRVGGPVSAGASSLVSDR